MPTASKPATDKVLAYIETLPDWSQEICSQLRKMILAADTSITEEWKWGPHYSSQGMVCGFGAFQKHVKLTFFNGSAMHDPQGLFNHCTDNEFSRSIKYTTVSQLDSQRLTSYVKAAVAINHKGFKRVVTDKTVVIPDDLKLALSASRKATVYFDNLSYGYQKEYAEHVTMAKQEKTRNERIAKIIGLCEEGKTLNHKYKK